MTNFLTSPGAIRGPRRFSHTPRGGGGEWASKFRANGAILRNLEILDKIGRSKSKVIIQSGPGARTAMPKLAFLASFLAAFITMDAQLFHGETTRAAWNGMIAVSQAAQAQVAQWSEKSERE
jgi:hypothetical protein